jgi:aspartate 1-decarboxylase
VETRPGKGNAMNRHMLRSKIHRAKVTGSDLNYEGSITIDRTLMDAAGIIQYEKVMILNLSNGLRAETYAIHGKRDSGEIVMNGAIARLAQVGDLIIILTFTSMEEKEAEKWKPAIILVDDKNGIVHAGSS